MPKQINNDIQLWFQIHLRRLWDKCYFELNKKKLEPQFSDVGKCVLFIGYPRSGHSFVGSILDAHPQMLIAHRIDAVASLVKPFDFIRLGYLIQRNSERFAANNRQLTDYAYPINTGWQGRYRHLLLIGDQEGRRTSVQLGKNLSLVKDLISVTKPSVQFLHVTRNPFDNIATWSMRARRSVETMTKKYFELCQHNKKIMACVEDDRLLTLKHEDLIADFNSVLSGLLEFLGLSEPDDYISTCRSTVYTSPNRSRDRVVWNNELIRKIEQQMKNFEFLHTYNYEN